MVSNVIKTKYADYKVSNSKDIQKQIKSYIDKCNCSKIRLDLSALNILDATKAMMLSSAYHYRKFPEGRLVCKTKSDEVKGMLSSFKVGNLTIA